MKNFPYVLYTSEHNGYCKINCSFKTEDEIWEVVIDIVKKLEKGQLISYCDKERFIKLRQQFYPRNRRFAIYLINITINEPVLIFSIWSSDNVASDIAELRSIVEEVLGVRV